MCNFEIKYSLDLRVMRLKIVLKLKCGKFVFFSILIVFFMYYLEWICFKENKNCILIIIINLINDIFEYDY